MLEQTPRYDLIFRYSWKYKRIISRFPKIITWETFQIYLRINGTKGKLPKQQLKKSGASVKKKKKFKFTKGSTNVFKLTGKDVGELKSIVVEVQMCKLFGVYVKCILMTQNCNISKPFHSNWFHWIPFLFTEWWVN